MKPPYADRIRSPVDALNFGRRTTRATLGAAALVGLLGLASAQALSACPPPPTSAEQWLGWRAQGFAKMPPAEAQAWTPKLLDCLSHADPRLRDEVAYEAVQAWLRAGHIPAAQVRKLGETLLARLSAPDPLGVGRSFALLLLAEVVRYDRTQGLWSETERAAQLEQLARVLESVRDYRGYSPDVGWRHALAHAADGLMQFTLNPRLSRAELDRVLLAVASQVAAHSGHAYVHGESQRLARPVLFAATRLLHSTEEWTAWLAALVPASPASPNLESLAQAHNRRAFLAALYVAAQESGGSEWSQRLLPGVRAAMRRLPPG